MPVPVHHTVDQLFVALSECQALNPDPEDMADDMTYGNDSAGAFDDADEVGWPVGIVQPQQLRCMCMCVCAWSNSAVRVCVLAAT